MKRKLPLYFVFALLFCVSNNYAQTTLGLEDFDGNSVNLTSTTNVAEYGMAGGTGGDVFGVVDGQLGGNGMPFDVADDTVEDVSGARTGTNFPGDTSGIAGQNTTAFFALNDADGVGVNNAVWTFSGWGTATLSAITIDLAAIGDFETGSSDGFLIEAAVDGGAYQEIFRAATDESASKTYRALDGGFIPTENDPLELFIDGSATPVGFLDKCDSATGNFDTYTSTLLNGIDAASVNIRVSYSGTPSGSEPMGIDNITISGATSASLVISEIMYNPNSPEPEWEWVEVYNPGATALDLTGYVIDDNNGAAHTVPNIAGGTIAAGSSGVLFNADALTEADFTAAWGTVALIPVTNWTTMSLNNSGDTVGIWEDFASYSGDNQTQANVLDNVAFNNAAPWPATNNASSIYLTDLTADNDDPANWALSTNGGATPLFEGYTSMVANTNTGNDIGSPGTLGAIVLPLLISEVTVTPTAGEFIEIFNPNATAVDLTNVYLTDATFAGGGAYYYNIVTGANAGGGGFGDFLARFPNGATIAPNAYQTVAIAGSNNYNTTYGTDPTYELYEDGATADGIPDMLEGLPGSINGQGGLTNGGEVAILFYWDGESDLVTDLDYVLWGDTDEAVDKTGISIDGPDADGTTSTYANDTPIANQDLVATTAHATGDSYQRQDFAEGTEVSGTGNGVNGDDETSEDLSATWCLSAATAGVMNTCAPVVVPTSLISEVQGNTGTSPVAGTTVTVSAIVVGDFQANTQLRGFFLQEEDADTDVDPMTSEGIFVFCETCPTNVAVGDLVEVTGTAVEFFGTTQIDITGGGTIAIVSNGNTLPTPATLTLPAPAGTDMEATYESVESMLVTYTTDLVVSEYFELARYGQLVLNANERVKQFTDTNEPDVAGYAAYLAQLESSRIILDDDNNIQNAPTSGPTDTPYFYPRPGLSNTNFIRGGDQISNLTGIMHWSFAGQSGTDAWRIRPVLSEFNYDFTSENPRSTMPEDVGGSLKVASFNVLNYFTTLNERGANSIAELDRQREKIAAAICGLNADIVGLIEIENNGTTALNDLLNGTNGINATCTATYAALDAGVIGTDEIAVAFIYNTATVSLEGAFAILDGSVDPRYDDNRNRPALAQSFKQTATDEVLTVVVNHLKSKGSSCAADGDPDLNDGAGNCNVTRAEAAAALVDWLATDPTASGDTDFLIIGDLNSYKNEDPIDNILVGSDDTSATADDYNNLIEDYQGADAYSFVFDGQLGYLDYALSSASLTTQVTGTTIWHINADEINLFDYNDDIQDAGEASFERESSALPIYEPNAYRASDHDAVLVGIELSVAPVITCPADIAVVNDAGECSAVVAFDDATATDVNGDLVSVLQTNGDPSGSAFPVGVSTIEFTATDAAGNESICIFTITVTDEEAPVLTCPTDQTIVLDAGITQYMLPDYFATGDATAVDNCTDPVTVTSQDPVAGTLLEEGTTTVTITATDDAGNEQTCSIEITVELTLGVADVSLENGIVLYPNPTTGTITLINKTNDGLQSATIRDVSGKTIQHFNLTDMASETQFDVSQLASGVYLVTIQGETGIITKRMVKK